VSINGISVLDAFNKNGIKNGLKNSVLRAKP